MRRELEVVGCEHVCVKGCVARKGRIQYRAWSQGLRWACWRPREASGKVMLVPRPPAWAQQGLLQLESKGQEDVALWVRTGRQGPLIPGRVSPSFIFRPSAGWVKLMLCGEDIRICDQSAFLG